jgi:hypothetical protein
MARGVAGPRDGLQRVERAIQALDAARASGDPAAAKRAAANLRTELMLADQELKARGAALDSLRMRAEAMLDRG